MLRVSPIEQYDRKKSEYELMSQVATLGVPMCKPLEFGTSDEGVYSIQTWIVYIDSPLFSRITQHLVPYIPHLPRFDRK